MNLTKQQYDTCRRSLNMLEAPEELQDALIEHDLSGPSQIVRSPRRAFVREAGKLGLDPEQADRLYKRADKVNQKALQLYMNIRTTLGSDYYRALKSNAITDEFRNEFEEVVNYQQLFGAPGVSGGEDWASVFGPAAYFVDLMRITDRYVTGVCKDIPKGYKLGERRPDLERIVLNDKNTNQEVSYLTIVNERLKDSVKTWLGDEEPERAVSRLRRPFGLPVNVPLEDIRLMLKQKGTSLAELYLRMAGDEKAAALEALSLTQDDCAFLTKTLDEKEVEALYGLEEGSLAKGGPPELEKTEDFLRAAGLERPELENLLERDLKPEEERLRSDFYINRALPDGGFLREEKGRITPLNVESLTRIYRFLRLSKVFDLSCEQTERLLTSLSKNGEIDKEFLETAAVCVRLYRRTGLPFEDFFSLMGAVGTTGEHSAFDRIFNQEVFPYHPKYAGNPAYADEVRMWTPGQAADQAIDNWLSASCGLRTGELKKLAVSLFKNGEVPLTVENLSRIYGHSVLAGYFNMDIAQYLLFLSLFSQGEGNKEAEGADKNGCAPAFSAERLAGLLNMKEQLDQTGLTVYEVDFLCRGTVSPYVPLKFTGESLASFLSFAARLNAAEENGRKSAGESDKKSAESPDKKSAEWRTTLVQQAAAFLGTEESRLTAVEGAVNQAVGLSDWTELFSGTEIPEREAFQVILMFNRLLFLTEKGICSELIAGAAQREELLGFTDFGNLEAENLLSLFHFQAYFTKFQDESHQLLSCRLKGSSTEDAALKNLSEVTLWDGETLKEIADRHLKDGMTSLEQLNTVNGIMELCLRLGSGLSLPELLLTLKEKPVSDYDGILEIRNTAGPILSAAPGTGSQGEMEDLRRNIFLSILCDRTGLKKTEVYKYLLIDPEMSGKTRITVLREAMNAVQLYLKRCHMGLEKGVSDLEIDDNWWSWIMDYNLWRANREIFVYPENYLVPSLRHTKTSLFEQVESGLLQSNVDKNYLEELYGQYFEDFSDLAQLDICAALQKEKELYLFGRTKSQPYCYYWCSGKNGQAFKEWKKIETNIDGEFITPVFAGGRLFLFWARLQKTGRISMEGNASVDHDTWRVSIRYIFMNARKRWSAPQDLIQDELVCYEEAGKNPLSENALFKDLFRMEDPIWKKVTVIPVKGKNLKPSMEREDTFERLIVFYGPLLNGAANAAEIKTESADADCREFLEKKNRIVRQYKNMEAQGLCGRLCAGFTAVFNMNFQKSFLMRENEFLLLDEYAPSGPAGVYAPQTSLLTHSMGLILSPYTIQDMYWGTSLRLKDGDVVTITSNSFIDGVSGIDEQRSRKIYDALAEALVINTESREDMAQVDEEILNRTDLRTELIDRRKVIATIRQVNHVQKVLCDCVDNRLLFGGGVENHANLVPVANQPGAFILDNGDEAFLFQAVREDQTPAYGRLDENLTVSGPLASTTVLRASARLGKKAPALMQKLQGLGLTDERGIIKQGSCTQNAVQELFEDEDDAYVMLSLLQNDPLADPLLFVDEQAGMNEAFSRRLYDWLKKEEIIADGRISLQKVYDCYLQDAVEEMLEKEMRASQNVSAVVDAVYRCLSRAPVPVSLRYWADREYGKDALSFRMMRLSNGAVQKLKNKIEENGVKTLLDISTQNLPLAPALPFERFKAPKKAPFARPQMEDGTGVDFYGLYGEYFWELFYHIPMLIAQNRKDEGSHGECQEWQEYIFSPTRSREEVNESTFWRMAPDCFTPQLSEKIYKLLLKNNIIDPRGTVDPAYDRTLAALEKELPDRLRKRVRNILDNAVLVPENAYYWNFFPFRQHKPEELYEMLSDKSEAMLVYQDDPFDPHGVARLRIGAYEKYTVMQYVENIIEWGDKEFSKNSWESLTLASMYYITAYELLGPKPAPAKKREKQRENVTFKLIREKYNVIPPFLIEMVEKMDNTDTDDHSGQSLPFTDVSLFFGVPENEMLTKLWDLVEDRLYKLRNCLDLNGSARLTEIYGTRLDPLQIARAVSSAVNAPAALNPAAVNRSPYRFSFLADQAKSLAGRLASVGSEVLSVLEKKDAQEAALTAESDEQILSEMLTSVKELQIKELEKGMEGLKSSYEGSVNRQKYYTGLLEKGLSEGELESLAASDTAFALSTAANVMKMAASAAHALPQVGSPFAMTYGGVQVGSMLSGMAEAMELGGGIASFISGRSATMAGYERRRQEWEHQKKAAEFEQESIRHQIEGQEEHLSQSRKDLECHLAALEQKKRMLAWMKSKFTGVQLYQWMLGSLNTVMWQTYRQALELSQQAQEAYRFEKDAEDSFIEAEYWDSAKKGLLAGEHLLTALNQMQLAYQKKNSRKLEIEKHISLAQCCPQAFMDLKNEGKCNFELTERMFDYDYPGCYARKIAEISISVPALLGPYQNIKAILKQVGVTKTVTGPDKKGVLYLLAGREGTRPDSVRIQSAENQCIAISKGIDDSGMFVLNFGDERYLPFEGTGVVSSWELSMPKNTNRFDFNSITDVIVHVRYRASFDEGLKAEVEKELSGYPIYGSLYYTLAGTAGRRWNPFDEQLEKNAPGELGFSLSPQYAYLNGKKVKELYFRLCAKAEGERDENAASGAVLTLELPGPGREPVEATVTGGMAVVSLEEPMERLAGDWKLTLKGAEPLRDIEMLLVYEGRF